MMLAALGALAMTRTCVMDDKTDDIRTDAHPVTVEMLAAILWREQVVDVGVPDSVIAGRTPMAFCNESDATRAPFLKYARAAIAAMKGEAK